MKERRKSKRVEFRESVRLSFKKKPRGCLSVDLSESGMKLISLFFISRNDEFDVDFKLKEKSIHIHSHAVWTKEKSYDSDIHHIGIEFIGQKLEGEIL